MTLPQELFTKYFGVSERMNLKHPVERAGVFSAAFDIMVEADEYAQLLNITNDGETVMADAMMRNWHRITTLWHVLQNVTDQDLLALDRMRMGVRLKLMTDVTKPIIAPNGVHKFIVRLTLEPIGLKYPDV